MGEGFEARVPFQFLNVELENEVDGDHFKHCSLASSETQHPSSHHYGKKEHIENTTSVDKSEGSTLTL